LGEAHTFARSHALIGVSPDACPVPLTATQFSADPELEAFPVAVIAMQVDPAFPVPVEEKKPE
jgi:hypothetical protein